ncbi:polysaccharide biosynthesis/export family protein [Pararhodospirillum oryzae]|uniref:Uncharacterized protein n=1 Tax=Pararhodospirillum oryzae TaxID=478448 RepID=A0A512H3T4_9PROT|nr:polysaccharide biosynthesis/export family protein [Pararhodospirillum oryzae]GEO80129.1 hypothetical protein ROR02_02600 [Pararhodospirillum oryzae]
MIRVHTKLARMGRAAALGVGLGGLVLLATPLTGRAQDGASVPEMGEESAVYTINPGDVLQVTVWKEEGLDRECLVVPDGSISFPLIGGIKASGKTTEQLRADLEAAISPMIRDTHITVTVKAALGNSVSVLGQVARPGDVVLSRPTTVLQALSQAGGLTPYAAEGRIIVIRSENQKETAISFAYDDVARGEALETNILLRPGDTILVPTESLF